MSTVTQILADRATAGTAYSDALAALKTAWTNLRAIDIALQNGRVRGLYANSAALVPVYTFPNPSEWSPRCLTHPVYAATPEYVNVWEASAQNAAATIMANAT